MEPALRSLDIHVGLEGRINIGKTDLKDARVIAQLVRYRRYLHSLLPEGVSANLREFVRIRHHLVTELTEKRNYLRRLLDCVFPEIFTVQL